MFGWWLVRSLYHSLHIGDCFNPWWKSIGQPLQLIMNCPLSFSYQLFSGVNQWLNRQWIGSYISLLWRSFWGFKHVKRCWIAFGVATTPTEKMTWRKSWWFQLWFFFSLKSWPINPNKWPLLARRCWSAYTIDCWPSSQWCNALGAPSMGPLSLLMVLLPGRFPCGLMKLTRLWDFDQTFISFQWLGRSIGSQSKNCEKWRQAAHENICWMAQAASPWENHRFHGPWDSQRPDVWGLEGLAERSGWAEGIFGEFLKKQEIGPAIPASRKKTDGLDSSEESFMSYLWVNLITTSLFSLTGNHG